MGLPLAKAELIGTLLEAIFCGTWSQIVTCASGSSRVVGMYYAFFFELLRILYARLRTGRRWTVLFFSVAATIMFVLITAVRAVPLAVTSRGKR